MASQSISKGGQLAIALAVIAGLLALSRAIYNYTLIRPTDIRLPVSLCMTNLGYSYKPV